MKFIIIIYIFSFYPIHLLGNEQVKTSNADLRSQQVLLSISDIDGNSYRLFQGLSNEFFLVTQMNSMVEKLKISNLSADEFDKFYVAKFIHLKYSLAPFKGKNCSKSFSLSMRGETQFICQSESEKNLVMNEVLMKLKSIHKK